MKLIITTFAILMTTTTLNTGLQDEKVKTVVERFITATDDQNAALLASTMHDEAMQYVLFGPRVLTFSKAAYLEQLKAKKVGGRPRTIAWAEVINSGTGLSTVQLTATSDVLKFHYQVTLLSIEGQWQITAINTEVERL